MRKSNVDISNLPKFTTYDEAAAYFNRFGKLIFFGWELSQPPYAVHTFSRRDGREYFVDIQEDGAVSVIQRDAETDKNF
jgi:hypothetical protein